MKSSLFLFVLAGLLAAVPAYAGTFLGGGDGGEIGDSLDAILQFIDTVIIPFILSIGFLVFVWGMFKYFIQGGANDEAKESGKSLIMYAIAGYVVILAFWGIVNILTAGLGLDEGLQYAPQATPQGNL